MKAAKALLIFLLPISIWAGSYGISVTDTSMVLLPARPIDPVAYRAMVSITNDQILTQGQLCKVSGGLYMALEAGTCTNIPSFGADYDTSGDIKFYNVRGRSGTRNGYAICNTSTGDLNIGMSASISASAGVTVVEDVMFSSDSYDVYSGPISAIAQAGLTNYVTVSEW